MDRGLVKSLKHWGERLEAGFNDEGGREIYGKRERVLFVSSWLMLAMEASKLAPTGTSCNSASSLAHLLNITTFRKKNIF